MKCCFDLNFSARQTGWWPGGHFLWLLGQNVILTSLNSDRKCYWQSESLTRHQTPNYGFGQIADRWKDLDNNPPEPSSNLILSTNRRYQLFSRANIGGFIENLRRFISFEGQLKEISCFLNLFSSQICSSKTIFSTFYFSKKGTSGQPLSSTKI